MPSLRCASQTLREAGIDGTYVLDHHARLGRLWRMPVMIATLAGLAVSLAGLEIWPPLMVAIRMVGDISVPLLLFALGVRLSDSSLHAWRVGLLGAVARPLIGFVLALGIAWLLGLDERQRALLLVFGALPPAVLNYVFAERYRQEPDKVAAIVVLGEGDRFAGCAIEPVGPCAVIASGTSVQKTNHREKSVDSELPCDKASFDADEKGHDAEAGTAGGAGVSAAESFPGQGADRVGVLREVAQCRLLDGREQLLIGHRVRTGRHGI